MTFVLMGECFFYDFGGYMEKVVLKHISKTFQVKTHDVHAVKDVSLSVDEGDIFGVIGFSGAGKSTLIRCINLLERPTSGEVWVNGKNLIELPAKQLREERKKIGMIFQHFNLMRSRTVAQNIAYPLKGSGKSKAEIEAKVSELLELVELSDKAKAYPSQLSGGQKQRVAIARALANDPSILLCDEATSALDPQTTQSILQLLKEVNEKLKLTIVIITHEMAVVKQICNRVAIMENGVVVEQGNIVDIFSNPQNQTTKNFINTTTSINEIYEMIEEENPLVKLEENETMLRLTYGSSNTDEPIMSELVNQFNLEFNIVFANVEVLSATPIGNLVVKLKGETKDRQDAISYIEKQGVKVEVLN
ncbi:D-methionine transport system ATP-binding protein [Breznakia blatticola]|uniref:D-methionine transport system ATP-binding protein n=2 Tax=Breznakia blatticola TaxID=1754012 RepID=A0A4R8A5D0_9FIRM|nr:D-methionine transport system ATP-binding protein [Breznakia blatticola]